MNEASLISTALGSVVGVILALTGAGGGIVAVPLLVFGLGLNVATAGPIGLLAVGMAAGLGALLALRERRVRYKAATLMAVAGSIVSPAGLWLAQRVPNAPLMLIFAAVLLYVAARMLMQQRPGASGQAPRQGPVPVCRLNEQHGKLDWTAPCARALTASGALAGLLSGLLGVGGGFVIVPALKRVSDIPMQGIVATSLAVITLVSITGVVASAASGHMLWASALPFTLGALVGMLGGRRVARHLSAVRIQQSFAVFTATIAVCMAVKALRGF